MCSMGVLLEWPGFHMGHTYTKGLALLALLSKVEAGASINDITRKGVQKVAIWGEFQGITGVTWI